MKSFSAVPLQNSMKFDQYLPGLRRVTLASLQKEQGWKKFDEELKKYHFDRIIMGAHDETSPYLSHNMDNTKEQMNKAMKGNEKDVLWFVSNPENYHITWTRQWNMAIWAAGIHHKKEFHLITPLWKIVWRACQNLKDVQGMKKYGPGGVLPELLWLMDNHYEFIFKDGRWIVSPSTKTPELCIMHDYIDYIDYMKARSHRKDQFVNVKNLVNRVVKLYETLTKHKWDFNVADKQIKKGTEILNDFEYRARNGMKTNLFFDPVGIKNKTGISNNPIFDKSEYEKKKNSPSPKNFSLLSESKNTKVFDSWEDDPTAIKIEHDIMCDLSYKEIAEQILKSYDASKNAIPSQFQERTYEEILERQQKIRM
jgi:hypothetical protein